jgi:pimeloyl-ACP methyl ester carboxylesterase
VPDGRLVAIDDTSLHVVERGGGDLPLLILHGGPGLDHREFDDYLDPLGDVCRLVLVDLRHQGRSARDSAPSTWTLERMAQDVQMLALAMRFERYAVLGHSFGAFVALQHAIDHPGVPVASILSCGLPASTFMESTPARIAAMEPSEVREKVEAALAAEADVSSPERLWELLVDEMPAFFADPVDPRIADYVARTADTVLSPEVLAHVASSGFAIDLVDRLPEVPHPVLVLAGRHDRVCPVEGSEATAAGIPGAELVVFERSGHMPFVEEPEAYVAAVRGFLARAAR